MARDVEFSVAASDKTGPALASVERGFAATAKRLEKQQDDLAGSRLIQAIARSSPQVAAQLTKAFSTAASAGPALLAAGLAVGAPAIGAVLSAAVIGGAGIGGVIGGVLLAAKDPRVAAAGSQLSKNMLGKLEQDAAPFVEPVLTAIGTIDRRFDQMRGHIQSIFKDSANFVAPLTEGALGGIDGVLRGFDSLVAHAGPVINELGHDMTAVGQSVGDAMDTIAGGSTEAADALGDLTTVITFSVQSAGGLVRALTEVYGAMKYVSPIGDGLIDLLGKITGGSDDASKSTTDLARASELAAQAAQADADATARTNQYLADSQKLMAQTAQAARDLTTANQGLYGAETSLGDATDRVTKARKENGRTLDQNTVKGRANREALLGQATAAQRVYEGFVRVNGEGPRSAALAESLRAGFIRSARSFGLSADQAQNLANKILGIPRKHDTKINADPSDAIAASKAAKDHINSVHSRTVSIDVIVNDARLRSVENRLNRMGGSMYGAAGPAWAANDPSSGTARTGGPQQVNVSSAFQVMLDGQPFREITIREVAAANRRRDYRQKVGKRS